MSSRFGARIDGKRRRSTAMIAVVSSTERVVWVMYATRSGSANCTRSASSTVWISTIASGASPVVPTTSSCPSWPISAIV
jgi:hypothetical protein